MRAGSSVITLGETSKAAASTLGLADKIAKRVVFLAFAVISDTTALELFVDGGFAQV